MGPARRGARIVSKAGLPVFSRSCTRRGGFQILRRLFSEGADTIPHLTHSGCQVAALRITFSLPLSWTADVGNRVDQTDWVENGLGLWPYRFRHGGSRNREPDAPKVDRKRTLELEPRGNCLKVSSPFCESLRIKHLVLLRNKLPSDQDLPVIIFSFVGPFRQLNLL